MKFWNVCLVLLVLQQQQQQQLTALSLSTRFVGTPHNTNTAASKGYGVTTNACYKQRKKSLDYSLHSSFVQQRNSHTLFTNHGKASTCWNLSTNDDNNETSDNHNDDDNPRVEDKSSDDTKQRKIQKSSVVDTILSKLTSAFPFFVLACAVVGGFYPTLFDWANQKNYIASMLALIMCGMGLTLQTKDFLQVFDKQNRFSVPLGVACQFMIMPMSAYMIGLTLIHFLPSATATATATGVGSMSAPLSLFLGLVLVGCSPGGTASNLVSFIAHADVALSVILTSASTMLATVVTPLLVRLLVGRVIGSSSTTSNIEISGIALCIATARVVLLPVIVGMLLKARTPKLADSISRFTPFCSVLLVSIICGAVVAQNSSILLSGSMGGGGGSTAAAFLLPCVILSVLSLHAVGFAVGYLIPKYVFQRTETTARTISIETGMQNSALAVVLAQSIGAHPLATLPGALSATAHSCIGSLLAAYWRLNPPSSSSTTNNQQKSRKQLAQQENELQQEESSYGILPPGDDEDNPEFVI